MSFVFRFVFMVALIVPAFAYDWPTPDVQLVRTFGQRSGSQVLPGVEVQTQSPTLTAPDKGDALFVVRPGFSSVQNLPSGLGGFVAIAHEDNLRTVISHVDPAPVRGGKVYQKGEPLGVAEVLPGNAESRHRVFVFDQQLDEIVNPLLVFPPLADKRDPLVFDVVAVPEAAGSTVSLFGKAQVLVGYWSIHIQVADPAPLTGSNTRPADGQRGVYSVEAYLNGSEVFSTNLDSFQDKAGRWQIKGTSRPLNDVLPTDQVWNLGKVFINLGTNILEITVKDFQGNQAGRTFRVIGVHA